MNIFRRTLALMVCSFAASVGSAATVTVTFDDDIFSGSGSDSVGITFPKLAPASGLTSLNAAAGRFQGTGSKVVGVPESIFVDGLNDLFMYCYDLYEHIEGGQVVDYTINMNGALSRTLGFLGAVNSVMNSTKSKDAPYDPYAWLHPVDGNQGAAIQLGIWESKYETSDDWDLDSGNFSATGLGTPTADWWSQFKKVIGSADALDGQYVMTLEAAGAQDMITGDPPPNDVPEPGALALFGVGLAGLAGLAFLRRNKVQQ